MMMCLRHHWGNTLHPLSLAHLVSIAAVLYGFLLTVPCLMLPQVSVPTRPREVLMPGCRMPHDYAFDLHMWNPEAWELIPRKTNLTKGDKQVDKPSPVLYLDCFEIQFMWFPGGQCCGFEQPVSLSSCQCDDIVSFWSPLSCYTLLVPHDWKCTPWSSRSTISSLPQALLSG